MDNITGTLDGKFRLGNAGINRRLKERGYVCTLCMLVDGKFIDVHITKSQLEDLIEVAKDHLECEGGD